MKSPNPVRLLFTLSCVIVSLPSVALAQTTWSQRNQNTGSAQQHYLWSIAEGNAGLVAVGVDGRILHSVDGRTWARRTSGTANWLVAVTFGNGRYVAVGDNGTILTSTNALAWSAIPSTGTTARLNNVLVAQSKYVAVGEGGAIIVSTDGIVWNPVTSNVGTSWLRGLAYTTNLWVVSGQSGTVTVSHDGITWSKRYGTAGQPDYEAVTGASSSTFTYNSYIQTTSYFIAVGANGTTQGIQAYSYTYPNSPQSNSISTYTYSAGKPATTARFRSISNGNGVLIATGENGEIYTATSHYGPWAKITIATNKNLVGAGFALGSLFLVGENETIFQSEQILPASSVTSPPAASRLPVPAR